MFKLKENGTKVSTEIIAGITTFFTMAYIIVVNPKILSSAGMEWGAVFLATIIAAAAGTLIMGLFANVPYAQAPGMGLNAFFCLHGLLRSRLYLAASAVHGLHLRHHQHHRHSDENPKIHH
jgi:xanthine/uracil/vitamin C permease (AzgA family)